MIKSKTMRDGVCSKNGEIGNAHTILVAKSEGEKLLRIPRRRWKEKSILRKQGWEVVDWLHVAQDRDRWQVRVHNAGI
jgi:predicted ribosome-associated RNA-binding protein Tma20